MGWQAGFAIATLVAILLVLALQRQLLRRGLSPLERTRGEVRELELGTRHQLSGDAPAEIQPLIQAFNRLLETLEERLKRSRKAAGDLAHGLKTPLSMLGSLVERPVIDPPLRAEMTRQLALIQGRIERELRRARLMGGTAPGALFRPATDAADLVATLEHIHRDAGLGLETRIVGDEAFPADREDMMELLGNLLDNAFKWAAQRIELTVESSPETLTITLDDDGPGVPEEQLETLARRGRRLDETREGHGLGLAIVRDIVDFYGGGLAIGPSPGLGGLRVQVRLGPPGDRVS
ncbi:MAG: ATP-binding protein [Gammaproteobacteria bacterium]|nr:ATP-binding protein [Gammaproteobacteria bacterium]